MLNFLDCIPKPDIQGLSRSQCSDLTINVAAVLRLTGHRGAQPQPYKLMLRIGL